MESSDSQTDANAFQLREVAPSGKPSESYATDEDGSSSESPETIQKKAARKSKAEAGKKRQAAESTPPGGKAKKAKAGVEKAAPSDLNAPSKGKKQREKAVPADRSPSKPAGRRWTIEDEIKVLEALVSHVKANGTGTQPSATELIAAVGDNLERNNCSKTEMYEQVRGLKQRHEKAANAGALPGNEDDLRKFNLSEAVWGESAKEVAAVTISQNDGASSRSKKGQINKEKAKEAATTDTPAKSKKRGKSEGGISRRCGGASVRSKSGNPDKEKKNRDAESLRPKEGTAVTQNDDTLFKNGETHEEEMDADPNVENMSKGFDELQNLYPKCSFQCLPTWRVADEKACALEAKIKKQRVAEMKMDICRAGTKKEVTNLFIGLLD